MTKNRETIHQNEKRNGFSSVEGINTAGNCHRRMALTKKTVKAFTYYKQSAELRVGNQLRFL
jgi:hypothetical protein